jgi:hypothetical protein
MGVSQPVPASPHLLVHARGLEAFELAYQLLDRTSQWSQRRRAAGVKGLGSGGATKIRPRKP